LSYFWLLPIGFLVGTLGTLIGAGGGFILVPVLILLYPKETPDFITSLSLAVVFFNALSGSVSYAVMKRIDYKSGVRFALATIPGAILGSISVSYIPRRLFDGIFGILMIIMSVYLFSRNKVDDITEEEIKKGKSFTNRLLIDKEGHTYKFSFNKNLGIIISAFVGYLSSLLGIGGGIIHVPIMVNLLHYPVHIATATSHFILSIMAFTGTATNIISGKFTHGIHRTIYLSIGVLIGAQLGAFLSNKLKGGFIIKSLAIGLGCAGLRILLVSVH
jgi:uncharacterized membrane protein YfcA